MENFQAKILSNKPTLVLFYSNWYKPCEESKNIVQNLARKKNWSIEMVNVDEKINIVNRFKVINVPSYILFEKGEIILRENSIVTESRLENNIEEAYKMKISTEEVENKKGE